MNSGERPRTGIITDETKWKFYHMEKDRDYEDRHSVYYMSMEMNDNSILMIV
jgi:hypothetical protein